MKISQYINTRRVNTGFLPVSPHVPGSCRPVYGRQQSGHCQGMGCSNHRFPQTWTGCHCNGIRLASVVSFTNSDQYHIFPLQWSNKAFSNTCVISFHKEWSSVFPLLKTYFFYTLILTANSTSFNNNNDQINWHKINIRSTKKTFFFMQATIDGLRWENVTELLIHRSHAYFAWTYQK